MWIIAPYQHRDADEVAGLMDAIPELPSTGAEAFRAFTALGFNRGARDFRVARVDPSADPSADPGASAPAPASSAS